MSTVDLSQQETDNSFLLDNLSSSCCNAIVIKAAQVAKALQQQSKADFNSLRAIDVEQNKLRTDYLRFLDLEAEKKFKAERIRRTSSLISDLIDTGDPVHQDDEFDEYIIPVSDLTLWEAMLSVLEHTGEIQLFELLHVLEHFGKKVTRGAIESAIQTHSKVFQARTRGRDRFISLKR
jgi:hypothetical protein